MSKIQTLKIFAMLLLVGGFVGFAQVQAGAVQNGQSGGGQQGGGSQQGGAQQGAGGGGGSQQAAAGGGGAGAGGAAQQAAAAGGGGASPCTQSSCLDANGPAAGCGHDACDLIQLYINPFIKLLSVLVGLVAAASLILGGVQYSASSGDPQKTSAAKDRISKTILGLLAYAFLYAFLNFLVPGGIFQ